MSLVVTSEHRWCVWCTTMWHICLGVVLLCVRHPDGAAAQETTECTWQELEEAVDHLKMCNPQLSAISTTILLQPGDSPDYTLTCRKFQEYVDCMYPAFMCPTLLKRFWKNYETYKRPPYLCLPRNGTALPKHYKFTTRPTPIGGANSGHAHAATRVVTISALWILGLHIQDVFT